MNKSGKTRGWGSAGSASQTFQPWIERRGGALRQRFLALMARFDRQYMPFSYLSNCDMGSLSDRCKAYDLNRIHRDVILPFVAAWLMRSLAMGAALSTAARAQSSMGLDTTWLQAGFAVAGILATMVGFVLSVAWLALGFPRGRL